MPGGLPSASNTPERTARPLVTSCPSSLIFLPQVVLPTPLPFLIAQPGSCSGVGGGHKGQETAGLAGVRQTRPGLGIPPSSLPDLSRLLQVTLAPSLTFPCFFSALRFSPLKVMSPPGLCLIFLIWWWRGGGAPLWMNQIHHDGVEVCMA